MRQTTGMVIPVWYPDTMPIEAMEAVLAPCLVDVEPFAQRENVLVVVDGAPQAHVAAQRVQKRLDNFEILFKEQNEGKGGAVASGIERLLANPTVQFIVTRDHDNDHLANDALNLVRLAAQLQREAQSDCVMSIGRRVNVHRHLGFVRGEYEWMMNEVVFEAVKFARAREGKTVNTQFFAAYEPVPDMQTGFKCYTRATAQLLVDTLQRASQETPDWDVRRHGAEVPVIVETLLRGGTIGEVTRLAWENQPITTYDLAGRVQVKGTVLAWALRRADVPLAVARQLLCNAIARRTMAKEEKGLSDLLSLANWTLDQLSRYRGESVEPIGQIRLAEFF
ncbi:MAG: hypothetical protein RMK49_19745 [Abditibacteriales bacterium]|nr:hypothetical protein [Abditibacteriales bacterium]